MRGAQIAARLALSPETVRTHVRNARSKLGASTQSQAVALALRAREIGADAEAETAPALRSPPHPAVNEPQVLSVLPRRLLTLHDIDAAAAYAAEEGGLALSRVAQAKVGEAVREFPGGLALGEGVVGRAALERQVQIGQASSRSGRRTVVAIPVLGDGRLVGAVAVAMRFSRPVGRSELLLLRALANRVGEVVASGQQVERRLETALERFRASWTAARA